MQKDLMNGMKKVLVVFLVCFLALITYMAYFTVFQAPTIADRSDNKRLWAKRNEVLRGTIYDRDGKALTKSERGDTLTQKREYVYGDLFTHSLGFVDIKYGITGLESAYDNELMNTKNTMFNIKEALKTFNLKEAFSNRQTKEKIGNSLGTTLDYDLQKIAYDALGDNKGSVVVLDPKTGDVITMISKPTYDPNNLEANWADINTNEDSPLLNRATQGMYPPGSVFKIVTAASALENISGVTNKVFHDNTGKIDFGGGYSLSNYGGTVYGDLNLKDGFRKSSNVVFATLALELGNQKLRKTAEDFYFNKSIPSDGFSIAKGRFPTLESYEKGNIAQSGIGQSSILVSPMQMALVASTIANNGVMMEPKIVKNILNADGEIVNTIKDKEVSTVIPGDDAKLIASYMKEVVDNGTVRSSYFSGTNAAGKTGTADHMDKDGKPASPHSWFVGFAPYNNPKYAIAVIVENGGVGGGKAAQIAGTVLKAAVNQ